MNRVDVHYCYPTSDMAAELGKPDLGGFYVTVGPFEHPISQLFKTIHGAEGFCRNHGLTFQPHCFPVRS